ncbi:MAG: VWA domain-containing protein [Clostridia bacterium]|nr:VWA domain-containing protein [Clostridia bacterium]
MSSINFDNPWLLLLALPITAALLVPFFIAVRKDNANGHNIASCVMHVVMALIIAFVAAGTSVVTTVTETDVYVLADVSYSANRNLDAIDGYISRLGRNLPDHSRMGVVCFGKDYQLVTRLGERVKSVKTAEVDDTATDIVGALRFTDSLFRDNVVKRIVLITDGKETYGNDANALKREVDALTNKKVHVDAIYLDDNISGDAREVQLSDVRFTSSTCLNRANEQALITINCSYPEGADETRAVLTVNRNGSLHHTETVFLGRGANNVPVPLYTAAAGVNNYEVTISCEDDENLNNNVLNFTQTVSGELSVLLLTDAQSDFYEDDYRTIVSLYGDAAKITAFTYTGDREIPITVEALCKYDEIVLSNIDLTKIQNYPTLLQSLDTVVSSFGKSLISFGNVYVQQYGQGELSTLGDMLPVRYGKTSDNDKKLYTIAIDTSRSMEYYAGNLERAKEAAKSLVNRLADEDSVAVVTFNGRPDRVYDAAPLYTDRGKIIEFIDSLQVRQGTDISTGLNRVYDIMQGKDYARKRVMLISDGLNFNVGEGESTEVDSPEGWVNRLLNHDITTYTLDVGRGYDNDNSTKAAKALLERLAQYGQGRYYDITNESALDSFMEDGWSNDDSDVTAGRRSPVNVKRRADEVLKGVSVSDLAGSNNRNSTINDLMLSVAKNGATTVFTCNYYKSAANEGFGFENIEVPLYSYWEYGNGKVATFTSKVNGNWVSSWNATEKNKFFRNVFNVNVPSEKTDYPFILNIDKQEGYATVTLTPERVRPEAVTSIEILAPDGSIAAHGALAFGTSAFTYSFVTPEIGKYTVNISYLPEKYGIEEYDIPFEVTRYLDVSYSAEYDSFTLYDAAVLHKMLGAGGTVSEDGNLTLVNDESEIALYNMSLSIPLLAVCVAIYAVDIAVRKLKWEDIQSLFKKTRKVDK